ncbi:hypothetical protein KY363_07730 [Candidatus Woesearchaeota archaeon]|nr:hypothetical protein [Candidatus Woesearchaeota archaeon]
MGDERRLDPAFIAEHPETKQQYHVHIVHEIVPYRLMIGNPLEKMVEAHVDSFNLSSEEMGPVLMLCYRPDKDVKLWEELYFLPPDEFTEEASAQLGKGDSAIILGCLRYMGQATYGGQ